MRFPILLCLMLTLPGQAETLRGAPGPPSSASWTERRNWWSFQPLRKPEIPPPLPWAGSSPSGDSIDKTCPPNEIDAFVAARLAEQSLSPAAEADRRTLIRRLTFDLHGLLPAPEEVEAFLNDPDPSAWPERT